jgi:hypothetical protein
MLLAAGLPIGFQGGNAMQGEAKVSDELNARLAKCHPPELRVKGRRLGGVQTEYKSCPAP